MDLQDIRYGVRMLAKQPGFTSVAVLTLALGIGANTAIFTLFDAILLQSLPVREPHRLVLFNDELTEGASSGNPTRGRWTLFSYESYLYLRAQRLPFEALAAVSNGEGPVGVRLPESDGVQARAERAQAHLVSGNFFTVMGVGAALGRVLTDDDDRPNAPPVAVVSYGFWSDRLHGDVSAFGKIALINGTAFTIAGVAPHDFFGERVRRPPDFWIPLVFQPVVELRPSYLDRPNSYWLSPVGRLAANATRAQAQVATTGALQQFLTSKEGDTLAGERAKEIAQCRVQLADGAAGVSGLRYLYSQPLHVLLGIVALVLLLACANVGNLLLSRAAARQSEITVRLALGATRRRLIRQLLTESLLLAALGAIGGTLLARWVVDVLLALMVSTGSPVHASLDGRVLTFTAAIAVIAGLVFGLAPAFSAGRVELVGALKSSGRGALSSRPTLGLTRALVIAQLTISLVLLVGANLFARSLLNLEGQSFGFEQEHVLLARINPRLAGYTPSTVTALYQRLYDRVAALPGITSATAARYSPFGGSRSLNGGTVEGYTPKPGENMYLEVLQVAPTYPETLGLRLVQGRAIGPQDRLGAPGVAMVNETFVRRFVRDGHPLGVHVNFGHSSGDRSVEIVGVVADAQFHDPKEQITPMVFTALFQEASQFALDGEMQVRTAGDPALASNELRRAVAEIDANLPVNDPQPLRVQVAANFTSQRLASRLVSLFGSLALLLACVGLYGVVTQGVVQRTNEIGVRMALGAQPRDVIWMILRDTLALVAIGLAIGIPAALGGARLVSSQLYGIDLTAPGTFALAAVVLTVVTVTTGLVPARRAARVDPMVALRNE